MARAPMILALANPEPEILPPLAKEVRPDAIICTTVGIDLQDYYTKDEVYNKEQVDALPHVNAYSKSETDRKSVV